jgi:hypothetical protein
MLGNRACAEQVGTAVSHVWYLSLDAGYPEFSWFSSVRSNSVMLVGHDRFVPAPFEFSDHSTIQCFIV